MPHKPYVPQGVSELLAYLAHMLLASPTFKDKTGYLPRENIDTTFFSLNEGLLVVRKKVGEERYAALRAMSDKMRALFEADPDDKTGDTHAGCMLIHEMEDILKGVTKGATRKIVVGAPCHLAPEERLIMQHKPYVPEDIGKLIDYLAHMLFASPTFKDKTGYLPRENIETTFYSLNEGLLVVRKKLGEERYAALMAMSEKMRALFESDPDDKTGDARAGRKLIREMESILRSVAKRVRE